MGTKLSVLLGFTVLSLLGPAAHADSMALSPPGLSCSLGGDWEIDSNEYRTKDRDHYPDNSDTGYLVCRVNPSELPSDAKLNGFELSFTAYGEQGSNGGYVADVSLVQNGYVVGASKSSRAPLPGPGSPIPKTNFGGATDMWGTNFTNTDDLRSGSFGFQVKLYHAQIRLFMYGYMVLRVFYEKCEKAGTKTTCCPEITPKDKSCDYQPICETKTGLGGTIKTIPITVTLAGSADDAAACPNQGATGATLTIKQLPFTFPMPNGTAYKTLPIPGLTGNACTGCKVTAKKN